jgi:hypothetical protein
VVLWLRPRRLSELPVVGVLFDVGAAGHVRLLLLRLPHVVAICACLYVVYRFFGLAPPLGRSLLVIPVFALSSALPVTPHGAGVRDIVAFAALAPDAGTADFPARVVAAGVAYTTAATLSQLVIGGAMIPFAERAFAAVPPDERGGEPQV